MSTDTQKKLINDAFVRACNELGTDIQKLSCFYPNWGNYGARRADPQLKKAA